MQRCKWVTKDPLYEKYHDKEWGKPIYKDKKIFEFLVLESAQAGLSWLTILRKRENYRKAFADFDPLKVAKFKENDIKRLMKDPGIIRNNLKIRAAISNAKIFLEIINEYGTFSKYMWSFVNNKSLINRNNSIVTSPESDAFSKDLIKRGFKFFGSTIAYAHMQAVGMVNDHDVDCFLSI
ncbi:MAG: DNA-3-methyladenine glycosylase I [Candidatus Doudnabacteria bacterium]